MLLDQIVHVKYANQYINYKDLGYIPNKEGYVDIDVKDLPKNSQKMVKCKCDYCGKIIDVMYSNYIKSTQKNISKTACKECTPKKRSEGNLLKYGFENPGQFPNHTELTIKTNNKKYGTDYYMQTNEYKERYKKTVSQKYGYDNVSQIPEIREKISNSFYANGSKISSKQQRYICDLYNGILNYPIGYYNVDILLPNTNVIVEYNGGGHDLDVKLGFMTSEEFRKKELRRYYYLKALNYKQITITSRNDYIPQDNTLLDMLDNAMFLLTVKQNNWVEYDVDEGLIKYSSNKNGDVYDYGKLKRIQKEVS